MKNLLIQIDYRDTTGKFWADSSVKNRVLPFYPEKQNIHTFISELCKEVDYMELSYKGKPQATMYQDDKEGSAVPCGYVYRGRTDIDGKTALFDVWVSISEVVPFECEEI